jgi:hypothetical protein
VALESGSLVYIVDGPRSVSALDWWLVGADNGRYDADGFLTRPLYGWVPGHAGFDALVATTSTCPTEAGPIDTATIGVLDGLRALACFGGRPITVRGHLTCAGGIADGGVTGASWINAQWFCSLDDLLGVNGTPIDALHDTGNDFGTALATGHFDDWESRKCGPLPFGTSFDEPPGGPTPDAVFECRQSFVVTRLTVVD